MLISKKWLQQYLPEGIKVTDKELSQRVTFSLAEVEGFVQVDEKLKNIIIGEIKEIKPHPSASKLQIAIVDTGAKRKRTIVCAAKNIFEGAKVPLSLPGGIILNPKQELGKQDPVGIKQAEIYKVRSQGMLCSQKELGISDDHSGIWILPDEAEVGADLCMMISDIVFEIENKSLTHRPDCFSHLGIAREISSIIKTPFNYQESEESLIPTQTLPLIVKVEDKNLCKRYTAIAIQGVRVKPSPLWLQLKLSSCGIRPINNIVDSTNYVMLDLGQPLHAFDYNKLRTPRIIVRTAKVKEKIITLDGQTRDLGNTHLLICDPSGPIGIAGVMGGANSEIEEKTLDIVIESANFEMYNTRRTSRELGLRSEASTRFEKGLDPNLTLPALKKVVQLILEIAGGEIASELIDIYPEPTKEKEIEIETLDIPRLLGIEVSKEEIIAILESLQLEVVLREASATKIKVKVPTFRQDLNIKEDFLEEIARIWGYDRFKPTLPKRDLKPAKINRKAKFEKRVKQILSALGFDEIYTYSFVGADLYKNTLLNIQDCFKLRNPISPELTFMRTSLIPSLLEKVPFNLANFEELRIYESSKVYSKQKDAQGLPKQPKHIAGLICQEDLPEKLFFELKGKLQELIRRINLEEVEFEKAENIPYLHPAQQALIRIGKTEIGHLGNLHPTVKNNWEINKNCAIFVLDFEKLFENKKPQATYTKLSKYPLVRRDLSFWIDRQQQSKDILNFLAKTQTKFVTDIKIIDIFKDPKKKSQKSIAIQIRLQSRKATLTEEEIKSDIEKLMNTIEKLGGKVRKK